MRGVRANDRLRQAQRPRALCPAGAVLAAGVFETTARSLGSSTDSSKVALKSGSSQPGNMRRASVASNCVTSIRRVPSGCCVIVVVNAGGRCGDAAGDRQSRAYGGPCGERLRKTEARGLMLRIQCSPARALPSSPTRATMPMRKIDGIDGDDIRCAATSTSISSRRAEFQLFKVGGKVDAVGRRAPHPWAAALASSAKLKERFGLARKHAADEHYR
jgi:hypothetical protein